jgi:putative ABC transport system permease protein
MTGSLDLCWQLVRLGARSLFIHKLRSALTVLGMVFGVASVVSMLAISNGASHEIQEQWRRLGPDRILLKSVRPPDAQGSRDAPLYYGLDQVDLSRIATLVPGLRAVAPTYEMRKDVYVGHHETEAPIVGTTPPFLEIHNLGLARGRFLAWPDVEGRSNVAVLGARIARNLFGPVDPLDRHIRLGSGEFQVVGLLRPRAEAGASVNDPDDSIFIPLPTAQLRLDYIIRVQIAGGRGYERVELQQIGLLVQRLSDIDQIVAMLRRLLAARHPAGGYDIVVPYELLKQARRTSNIFSWVLGSIAGISLLVGGIGIMNIMLATVSERTREIGVRRAIGAKRWQVLLQFLVETTVLSTTGGVLGLLLGIAVPPIITSLSDMRTIVAPWSLALALGISVGVGVVFGMYPARRAALMDPIEALRYA